MESNEDPRYAKYNMYSQLQPWSVVGAPPCMTIVGGDDIPEKVAQSYATSKPHPWRPAMKYETIAVNNLPELPVTREFVTPCISPPGKTQSVTYPSLITGFERNPQHGARAALYTRYTMNEWVTSNAKKSKEAANNRLNSIRIRSSCMKLMKETDENTIMGQRDTGRRIGERKTDVNFWHNELTTELGRLISESTAISDLKARCGKATLDLEGPLHIAQECLYQREARAGPERVHDCVERALLLEIDNLRESRIKLSSLYDKIARQSTDCRAAQHLLEDDISHKQSTLGIDTVCHMLNNYSRGINFYGGIEKHDPSVSTQESWAEASSQRVARSQAERTKLLQLRAEAETIVNQISQRIWDFWSNTNNAFETRVTEMIDSKNKTLDNLNKIQTELFSLESVINLLQKAIQDKVNPMKVAHTRLESRTHREELELCRDFAHDRLVEEVKNIQNYVEVLHHKLLEAESRQQVLLKTRNELEEMLRQKVNALFIDREKCMGIRRAYAIGNEKQGVESKH